MNIQIDNNLILQAISQDFAEKIYNTINSQRPYLREWLPFVDTTTDLYDTVSYIDSVLEVDEIQREHVFVIQYRNDFAGIIGFKQTDKANKKTEIGYWLSEVYQGNGIIIRSCKELINFAINNLDINRIQIKVAVGNMKSKRIPQKLGFKFEGIERDGELLANGFTDIEVYSLLKSEFIYP